MEKKSLKLEGIYPAMVASFDESGALDMAAVKENIQFVLDNGCAGVVVNGSTGEAVNLSREEKIAMIKAAVEVCHPLGKKVITGSGSATTSDTLALTKDAMEAGADAALIITPFNNIPNQEGVIRHYTMAAEIGIPVIMYNIPSHTGVKITMDMFDKLIQNPNIIGMKDSSGDLILMADILSKYGDDVTLFTGCDDLCLQIFAMGATAGILCLANIAPKQVVKVFNDVRANDIESARKTYFEILPIATAIGDDVNFPAAVKEAVRQIGHPVGAPRLPILPVGEEKAAEITAALKYAGLA